jgi:hypothetical protein
MATMVASRFSVLSLDVDADDAGRSRKQRNKTPLGDSSNSVKDKSGSKSGGSAQSKDAKKKNTKKKGDTNNVSLVSSAK